MLKAISLTFTIFALLAALPVLAHTDEVKLEDSQNIQFFEDLECISISQKAHQKVSKLIDFTSEKDLNFMQMSFIAGPCKPVVLIAGIMGTKVNMTVTSCKLLEEFHRDIFQTCYLEKNKKCVEKTDTVWLNEDYLNDEKNNDCFAKIMAINFTELKGEGKPEFVATKIIGMTITYFNGNGDDTCGISSIQDLLVTWLPTYGPSNSPRGFKELASQLKKKGYIEGVNLFGLSYDWRDLVSSRLNQQIFKRTVDLAYKLSNKPALIVAHSMGGLLSLNGINMMSKEDKKQKIDRLITVGTPYIGAAKSLKYMLFGTKEFKTNVGIHGSKFKIGVKFDISLAHQKKLAESTMGNFQLLQTPFYETHKHSDWLNIVMQRVKVENDISNCVQREIEAQIKNTKLPSFFDFWGTEKKIHAEIERICLTNIIELPENRKALKTFHSFFPYPQVTQDCNNQEQRDSSCEFPVLQGFTQSKEKCIRTFWDQKCRLNVDILNQGNPIISIAGEKSNMSSDDEIKKVLEKHFIGDYKKNENFIDWALRKTPIVTKEVPYPSVSTTIIAMTSYGTEVKFNLDSSPKSNTDNFLATEECETCSQYRRFDGGDGTVPNSSLFAPFFSWINKSHEVELVQMCTNKQTEQISINNNLKYTQIGCDCGKVEENCSHAAMIGDSHLIKHVMSYIFFDRRKPKDSMTFFEDQDSAEYKFKKEKEQNDEMQRLDQLVDKYMIETLNSVDRLRCSNLLPWDFYYHSGVATN